jgi:MFS family permease
MENYWPRLPSRGKQHLAGKSWTHCCWLIIKTLIPFHHTPLFHLGHRPTLMGRLCDVFSSARINLFGFLIILLSGIIGVFAQNFNWLIVSRILLGLGSSAAYPSSMTLIKHRYNKLKIDVPGLTLSIIAIAGQVSLVFGPFLGGILLEGFGWKGIFFINIPLVVIGLLLTIPTKKHAKDGKEKK